jgi:hypothetical protein
VDSTPCGNAFWGTLEHPMAVGSCIDRRRIPRPSVFALYRNVRLAAEFKVTDPQPAAPEERVAGHTPSPIQVPDDRSL